MQSWTETQKMLTLSTHKYIIAWSIKTTIQFLKYLKCKGIFRHTFQVSSYWFLFHLNNFFPLPQTINKWLLLFPIFLSTSKIKTATVLTVTQNVGICNMLETEVPQNQPKQPNSTSVKNKYVYLYVTSFNISTCTWIYSTRTMKSLYAGFFNTSPWDTKWPALNYKRWIISVRLNILDV